jgi:exocyst complex component 4
MREGDYALDTSSAHGEVDSHILSLNAFTREYYDCISNLLNPKEVSFIYEGVGELMARMMISGAKHMRRLTVLGVEVMMRHITAVQHTLCLVLLKHQPAFDHARQYYQLYSGIVDLQQFLRGVMDEGPLFSFDEYRTIVELKYSHVIHHTNHPLKKELEEFLTKLRGLCGK